MGASAEAKFAQLKAALAGIPVAYAMSPSPVVLRASESLGHAMATMMQRSQPAYPVVEAGRVVGVIPVSAALIGFQTRGADTPVSEVMAREFEVARPGDMLNAAFERLRSSRCPAMPVVDSSGRLMGLLTPERIGQLVMAYSEPGFGPAHAADARWRRDEHG